MNPTTKWYTNTKKKINHRLNFAHVNGKTIFIASIISKYSKSHLTEMDSTFLLRFISMKQEKITKKNSYKMMFA